MIKVFYNVAQLKTKKNVPFTRVKTRLSGMSFRITT